MPNTLNKKRILIVDDEEMIRELLEEIISSLGHTSESASNGINGLEMIAGNSDYNLVILDMNMPLMDGRQCYTEIRKTDKSMKIIMSSGMDSEETQSIFGTDPNLYFVQKPYSLAAISQTINKALGV